MFPLVSIDTHTHICKVHTQTSFFSLFSNNVEKPTSMIGLAFDETVRSLKLFSGFEAFKIIYYIVQISLCLS